MALYSSALLMKLFNRVDVSRNYYCEGEALLKRSIYYYTDIGKFGSRALS